ncbi:hypothetical protein HMPREF6123_0521 [Oribacterium sinus F0268]|uniref:Uncharacterized protein n=1 Tax=Oribacterium sinus F0268 TaxID=585501 RepID=C2KVK2_9FIRM|nr:hypothetical protein HMPREF6123_0521 [Oribacterium sinus F0268]
MNAHEDGSITEKKFFPLKFLFSNGKKTSSLHLLHKQQNHFLFK